MRESKIEKWYCDKLRERGALTLKLHMRGWPDRMFLHDGDVCFVEFKRTGETVRNPHQMASIGKLADCGFIVFEVAEISESTLQLICAAIGIEDEVS